MLNDFYTIEVAMSNGLIPESYHNLFKKYTKCPEIKCGSDIIINTNRTVMKCSNPNCIRILSGRVLKIYNSFGIMDFGPQSAYDYINIHNIHDVPGALVDCPKAIEENIVNWFNSYHTPGEVLEMLAIPGIGTKAHKIMNNINNFTEFNNAIDNVGTNHVLYECGLRGKLPDKYWELMLQFHETGGEWERFKNFLLKFSTTGVIPFNNYDEFFNEIKRAGLYQLCMIQLGGDGTDGMERAETMSCYWNEIQVISGMVKCYPNKIETRKIIITGDITKVTREDGLPFDRLEFINYINSISSTYGVRYQNSTAFNSSEFIIADYPSNTRKYHMGLEKGNLVNSEEFLNIIRKRAQENE